MSKSEKKLRQVCQCENCGNEAEMIITCTLEDLHEHEESASSKDSPPDKEKKEQIKGSAT